MHLHRPPSINLLTLGVRAPSLAGGDKPDRLSSPTPPPSPLAASAVFIASRRPGCVTCGIRSPRKVESMPPASEESRCCRVSSVRLTSHRRLKTLRSRPCSKQKQQRQNKDKRGGNKWFQSTLFTHLMDSGDGFAFEDSWESCPSVRVPLPFRCGKPTNAGYASDHGSPSSQSQEMGTLSGTKTICGTHALHSTQRDVRVSAETQHAGAGGESVSLV